MKRMMVASRWVNTAGYNQMEIALVYPGVWAERTGQINDIPAAGRVIIEADVADGLLPTILNDARFAVVWYADIDADGQIVNKITLPDAQARIAAVFAPDVAKLVTLNNATGDEIIEELKAAALRPVWKASVGVSVGDVVLHEGNLYECVQGHTTQAGWEPNTAVALWKRFYEPTDDPWPWSQPLGAHDAYRLGARVTHNGSTWESTLANNVWQPGVTGWTNLTPPAAQEWTFPKAYAVNDEVTYQGSTYRCQQAHTSQAGWTPPVVPALWLLL